MRGKKMDIVTRFMLDECCCHADIWAKHVRLCAFTNQLGVLMYACRARCACIS
jgi:hypothetical protein